MFAGTFSLDAAIDVCCFDLDKSLAVELVAGLVSKSLVTVDAGGATLRYGMFDTTKSYCWNKLRNAGELRERTTDEIGRLAAQLGEHRDG